MHLVKTAKIIFYFTVLLLFVKPFFGFSVFSRIDPPEETNILIKVFSKRKLECAEGSETDLNSIQQKLGQPVTHLFLRFSFFLALLFPAFFNKWNELTNGYLTSLRLSLTPVKRSYLLNGTLLI